MPLANGYISEEKLSYSLKLPWKCLPYPPSKGGWKVQLPSEKEQLLLCRQGQGMAGGITPFSLLQEPTSRAEPGQRHESPKGRCKGKAWEQAVTAAQLADVRAPGAAQLHCSSHGTSCELTSSQWAELTLPAFSDALAHLEQDSLMLHTKRSQVLTDRWCSAHTPYPEPGVIFKPLQIPAAFSRASLHCKPLKMTNTSHKSLSIKSFTCKRKNWCYLYQPLSQKPLQMLTLNKNWNI